MNNIWERIVATIKHDIASLSGKEVTSLKDAIGVQSSEQEKKAAKLEKQLQDQKQLIRQFEKEKDEVDVQAAARRRQLHLAQEEGEETLAAYAEKDLASYEEQSERLTKITQKAKEQLLELEQMFQEIQHQLKERRLDQMEMKGKEKAAYLRSEMRAMQTDEKEPAAEKEESEEEKMNSMERQLMLLEKRHAKKESPSDLNEK